jgi:hypothetical protein
MMRFTLVFISMVGVAGLAHSENALSRQADVRLGTDGKIQGRAATSHVASNTQVSVVESENCAFNKVSNAEIQLGSRCEFLQGVYTYEFTGTTGAALQMVLGFTASRNGSSEVFMVNPPIVVLAK